VLWNLPWHLYNVCVFVVPLLPLPEHDPSVESPFPLWVHDSVVMLSPFLIAIALEESRGASASIAVTAIIAVKIAFVCVIIVHIIIED
jgi:hypothetical protein